MHGPEHDHAPVLLYLHGEPGFAEHFFAAQLKRAWHGMFTQVHWDKRGIVEYLNRCYETSQVVPLGYSWGSVRRVNTLSPILRKEEIGHVHRANALVPPLGKGVGTQDVFRIAVLHIQQVVVLAPLCTFIFNHARHLHV